MFSVSVRRRGFTLTELLAALAIISLLVAIVLPRIGHRVTKARATRAAADIQAIELALENYVADWGRYPPIRDYGVDGVPGDPDDDTTWDTYERDGFWESYDVGIYGEPSPPSGPDGYEDAFLDERGRPVPYNSLTYMQYISIVLKKRASGLGPYLPKGVPRDPWGNEYVYAYIPNPTLDPIIDSDGNGVCDPGEMCQLVPRVSFDGPAVGAVKATVGMYYYSPDSGDRIPACDTDGDGIPDNCDGITGLDGMKFDSGPPYQRVFIYSRGRDGLDDFGFRGWLLRRPGDPEPEYGSAMTEAKLQTDPFQTSDAITNWSIEGACCEEDDPPPCCQAGDPLPCPDVEMCVGWEDHPFYN